MRQQTAEGERPNLMVFNEKENEAAYLAGRPDEHGEKQREDQGLWLS